MSEAPERNRPDTNRGRSAQVESHEPTHTLGRVERCRARPDGAPTLPQDLPGVRIERRQAEPRALPEVRRLVHRPREQSSWPRTTRAHAGQGSRPRARRGHLVRNGRAHVPEPHRPGEGAACRERPDHGRCYESSARPPPSSTTRSTISSSRDTTLIRRSNSRSRCNATRSRYRSGSSGADGHPAFRSPIAPFRRAR